VASKKKRKKGGSGGLTKKVSLADIGRMRSDGDGDSPKKQDGDSPKKGRRKTKHRTKARRLHADGDSPKADGYIRKKRHRKTKHRLSDADGDSPKKTLPAQRPRKKGRLLGAGKK
jgi:hypothetical protein